VDVLNFTDTKKYVDRPEGGEEEDGGAKKAVIKGRGRSWDRVALAVLDFEFQALMGSVVGEKIAIAARRPSNPASP